nr:MAG TPA: hypothetical protein [Bacteriophage sp.]
MAAILIDNFLSFLRYIFMSKKSYILLTLLFKNSMII